MLIKGWSIITTALSHSIAISIYAGLAVTLAVMGVQHLNRSFEERGQQHETRDYIRKLELSVFNETQENQTIELARKARKTDKDFPIPTRDQIRLERLAVALESLELHLTVRATLMSREDRFALLDPIIEARNVVNLFQEYQKGGGLVQDGVVTGVATEFFTMLREDVDWLGY